MKDQEQLKELRLKRFAKDRDDEKLILEKGYYGRLKEFLNLDKN